MVLLLKMHILFSQRYRNSTKDAHRIPRNKFSRNNLTYYHMDLLLNKLESSEEIAQVCVLGSNGNILTHLTKGHLGGLKSEIPMKDDTLVLGFSITKATITSTVMHIKVLDMQAFK